MMNIAPTPTKVAVAWMWSRSVGYERKMGTHCKSNPALISLVTVCLR